MFGSHLISVGPVARFDLSAKDAKLGGCVVGVALPSWTESAVATPGAAPEAAHMGVVELLVRDLDVMTDFYQQAATLDVLDQSGPTATLGSGGTPTMVLRQEKDLPSFNQYGAGLYHTEILFEDSPRLATALASLAQRSPHTYQGSADHLVSEAFYFADPEGNGLEIYRDRRRDQWNIGADGSVEMGTQFLDPNGFLAKWYDPEAVLKDETEPSAMIGHVHLQVGDIPTARAFYEGVLGFDVTQDLGSVLFLSAGGYHHHVGLNTWKSGGAGPRAASLGLGNVRIRVPNHDDIGALKERLSFHNVASEDDGQALRFADPWGTQLVVIADHS